MKMKRVGMETTRLETNTVKTRVSVQEQETNMLLRYRLYIKYRRGNNKVVAKLAHVSMDS
jgi:hypothetical protein